MDTQNANLTSVKGPDGQMLTLADLPSPGISRWVTRRKAEVVAAVSGGLLSRSAACDRYNLTDEEFEGWEKLYSRHGLPLPILDKTPYISVKMCIMYFTPFSGNSDFTASPRAFRPRSNKTSRIRVGSVECVIFVLRLI